MSKSVYQRRADMRCYAGLGVCLIVLLIRSFGVTIPNWLMGICAFGIVPYIIINALIVDYLERKHNYVD